MESLSPHVDNREKLVKFIRSEMMGPSLVGQPLDCTAEVAFEKWEDAVVPWVQKENGDEIIQRETPVNKYGIGVLYPQGQSHEEVVTADIADNDTLEEYKEELDTKDSATKIQSIGKHEADQGDSDDFDLTLTSTLQPSSMGISFLADLPQGAQLKVSVNGGRYEKKKVRIATVERNWFIRKAVSYPDIQFSADKLKEKQLVQEKKDEFPTGLALSIECYSRPDVYSPPENRKDRRLITVCLVNRTKKQAITATEQSEISLFQAEFEVRLINGEILPYPDEQSISRKVEVTEPEKLSDDAAEIESFKLLYNSKKTYAIGHGCAAGWDDKDKHAPAFLSANPLPEYEIPSITPDAKAADDSDIKISMSVLAGLEEGLDSTLDGFISEYRKWIEKKKIELKQIDSNLTDVGKRHILNAEKCLTRMEEGVQFIRNDYRALEAFKLANKAIFDQQLMGRSKRIHSFDKDEKRHIFNPQYSELDYKVVPQNAGFWRAFQIGFILSSLKSSVLHCDERETVELIWFPTGGGKTEGYLGLAAFTMFYNRLKDPLDDGVNVLMRYTLRLLTAQQFQRASRLICAMENIRQNHNDLGEAPFSIGIWVGSSNTPNKRDSAITAFNKLKKHRNAENPFIIRECPWCGAEMGKRLEIGSITHVLGYSKEGNTIRFKCSDKACPFSTFLPIYVIDEDIYSHRPSLIIGTVDKFAMLAWRHEAGTLFGLDIDGKREKSPPTLIIQDELHLISGPLGTMVGLYETVIEELCTIKKDSLVIKPKIVCSTATIRRYQDQILRLFARPESVLFPPPGLDAGDSFFARYATDSKKNLLPGRRYMGFYAPGLPSMQTLQVRLFSTILIGNMLFEKAEARDPWWTLLVFFNSIRELGGALSLFQTDIPGALKGIASRLGISDRRFLNNVVELTSRMTNEEVPLALEALSRKYTGKRSRAIDVCLASSIIEVGIDVDRLSLMSIVGQPKTISQYIQVSGRVGRKWWERPGLVATLFSSSKSRDRSHFEKFQSSHSQLYAQVEPTSVTPFSPSVIDRALHALFAIYLRLFGNRNAAIRPNEVSSDAIDKLKTLIEQRVQIVDKSEIEYVMNRFGRRLRQFNLWQRTWWANDQEQGDSLLRRYETWVTEEMAQTSWATPTSMRNVDAECQMDITTGYIIETEE